MDLVGGVLLGALGQCVVWPSMLLYNLIRIIF